MSQDTHIDYSITDEEWARTAGSRWNENSFPLFDSFFGLVNFRIGDESILGDGHFDMSVADLAVGLAEIIENPVISSDGEIVFQQSDDMLEIRFQFHGQLATVAHNLTPGLSWECSRSGFQSGVTGFVQRFSREAATRIPGLFDWRGLAVLEKYSV